MSTLNVSERAKRLPGWRSAAARRYRIRAFVARFGRSAAVRRFGVSRQRIHQIMTHPEAEGERNG